MALPFGAFKKKRELSDVVLKWSMDDVLNEDLLKHQIKKIPETFVSLNHYFESFRYPFVEETRARLASCLNSIADSPRIDVNIEKAHQQMEFAPNNLVGFRWSGDSVVGRKPYTPREGDLVLLTIMVPKDVSDLKKFGTFNCLAFVSEKYEERHFMARLGAFMGFTVKTTDLSFVAIFLLNIANKSHVWNAMNVNVDDPNANLNLIKQILCADGMVAKAWPCSLHAENTLSGNLLREIQPVELNESQTKAICRVLSTIRGCNLFSINTISGYPGTGKTEIISIICWMALQSKVKVVVCAPTTFSTFEVVQRFWNLVGQCSGNASKGIFPEWPLSDFVVLGDEHAEKLYISNGFADVLLEDRLILLEPCFSATSGWKKHMSLMIDLLENFFSKNDILLEFEQNDLLAGYLEIQKGRFAAVAFPFKNCIQLLLKYLPHTLFSVLELKNLSSLLNLIDSMWSILCDDSVKLKPVMLFTGNEVEERYLEKNGWTLSRARDYCLEILNDLIDALWLPINAGKPLIEHLCLKHAGLIFCPVPQSHKLKSIRGIGPFDVLIADRASEVNECELLLPLQLHGLQHAILVGGDCSMPAMVVSKNLRSIGYKRSLLERIGFLCKPDCTLEVQYRMHPEISYFPNKRFFNWKLVDSPKTMDGNIKKLSLPDCISAPFSFFDVSDGKESLDEQNEGWKNLIEAAVICKIIMSLLKAWRCAKSSLSVGVICPYRAQAHTIKAMLSSKFDIESDFLFWVSSCNELKSNEEDVIIISTVRSNEHGSIGLWSNHQITNYCLTRARKFLWIVGNAQTLKSSHSVWQELVHDAEERGLFVKVAEDKFLCNTIINVKDELKQLDELLNWESACFNGSKWKVLVSDDFKRSFVGLQNSLTKQIIIGLLWRLACGWRPKRKSLYFSKFVKQFRVHGLSLICTTDIIKESSEYIQVMKVWDVLTLTEVSKLHERLEHMMSSFNDCYVKCCMIEKIEGKLVLPMSWEICPAGFPNNEPLLYIYGIQSRLEASSDITSKGKDSEEIMLMKFYALSSGVVKHLLTAMDGQQIELPFELSDHEAEVVTFPDSAFVIGRSGTGKTLVLVTKLIQRQQHYFLALQGLSKQEVQLSSTSLGSEEGTTDVVPHGNGLHQIFLTMNPILCSAVKTCISQLRRYAAGEEAPERLKFIEAHGVSENLGRFSEIPNSFIEISESHFPLVISLHKFLIMLDGSMKNSFFDKFSDVKAITGGKRTLMSHVLCQLITIKEIDYDRFVSSYWPRFDKNLTRKLEPLLVFSEIIYCIKGGMGAGKTSIYENMDKQEYTSLSESRRSSVSVDKRKMIYKIFVSYEKQKEKFGEYDISDLVNDLHFRFSIDGYKGRKMDYLYIDEVQDFTMKQICLFKHVCVNFQSGLIFSGDTAQALVNDFRFEDIKNLFYKEFLHGLGSVPEVFLLSTNFRTHAGILKLAESILDLLHHFFPLLVKRLVSEKSMEHGEAPVLLESANETDVLDIMFGTNETIDHIPFQFGAEQVILVRDKHTKEKLVCRIGNKALVLTIKDCKGLEFQDVLLFNFFEESPLKKWSVVYEFMDNQEVANPCFPKYPSFDQDKHHILFVELKQLYVAVTRTKRRLWIYESRQGFGGPIFNYWKILGLVRVERLDSSFVRRMEVYCKIEEWDSRGMKFFNDGNYEMAILCFKRSGDVYMENWSKGALLQADGRSKLHVNFQLALDSLSKAADIYESIGKMELAASCFMESHKYAKAGMIYLHKFHEPRFEDAGDCYALAGSWSEAAKVYAQGQCLSKCLSACHQGLQFDMGFQFLREWHVMVPGDDWIDYLKGTISDYHKLQDIDSLEKFVRAFPTDALGLLLQSDHYKEASVVASLKGDIMLEADILRTAKHYEHSANLVLFYVIGKMLWADGNRGWPLKCFNELQQVLGKARSLCMSVSNDFKTYVSAEVDFLSDQSSSLSSFAGHINGGKTSRNICVETFAAWKYLDICLQTNASEYYQESDVALWRYSGCSLQDMFSYISIPSLMFSWNSWVKRVKGVLSYFHSIGTPEVSKYTKYKKFCMKFFGVLETDIEGVYISSNAGASWIQWKDENHLRILDNVAYMSDLVFNCLAEKYWASELISVGASLLQKLQELHSHLSRHIFRVVQQGLVARYFYKVQNCLKEHGFLGLECESATFYESLTKFDAFLFCTFFPLDFSRILEQIELSTQGTNTSLITAVLHRNLGVLDQFGAAKIGRVVVFLLSRNLSFTLHRTIRDMIGREFPWQYFLRELSYSRTERCQRTTPLAKTLLPSSDLDLHSQLLLLESILFYASSCQLGRGWFITSKSTLSAFLNAKESRSYFHALSVSSIRSLEHVYKNTTPFYDFILDTSSQLFSLSKLCWAAIKRLSTQSLVLKMVILVSLICLNSAKHFLKVRKMLKKVAGFLSILPHQFLIKFWNSRKGQIMSLKLFGSVLSRSMEAVGDQVVVVHVDDYSESFDHLRPLCLKHSDLMQGKEYAQALLLGINKV